MIKRAFLIHGWGGYPDEGWRPWLKIALTKRGFTVFVPAMPDTDHPRMNAWVDHLRVTVGNPDKHCYFVGHSLGCIAVLRYLEQFKQDEEIGGAVFLAGFSESVGEKEHETFFQTPVDYEQVKKHCQKFIAIQSDNDPWIDKKYAEILRDKLGAELIIAHNMKHFSGDDGITKLPMLLEILLKMVNPVRD